MVISIILMVFYAPCTKYKYITYIFLKMEPIRTGFNREQVEKPAFS